MRQLLLLSCGAKKRFDPGTLPALDRYTGPNYTTLKKFLREHPEQQADLSVLVLSAEFGLIEGSTPIPWYDRRMDDERARELRPAVISALDTFLAAQDSPFVRTFINLGRGYRLALAESYTNAHDIAINMRHVLGTITEARGGIGEMRGQMRRWLEAGLL